MKLTPVGVLSMVNLDNIKMLSVLHSVKSNLKLFKAALFTVCLLTACFSK